MPPPPAKVRRGDAVEGGGGASSAVASSSTGASTLSEMPFLALNGIPGASTHKIIFSFEEKELYFFEPFGGTSAANSSINNAFRKYLKRSGDEEAAGRLCWNVDVAAVDVKLQSDGHNCGVW